MKKQNVFFLLTAVIMIAVFSACMGYPAATTSGGSPGMDLDLAIKEAAVQMETKLPVKTTVALVSLASSSVQLSEYVISRLEAALVGGGKLVVVDRANLDKVRAEQGFQLSGEVDDNSAKEIGRMAGAGAIVTGTFSNLGDVYSLTVKAIDMVTATVAVSYPADIAKSARIETMMASGGGAGGGTAAASAGQPGRTQAASAARTPASPGTVKDSYTIGEAGPAGGFVFYDNEPAPVSEAAPATRTYTVGQNGPAGGLTFYDNEPRAVPAAAPVRSALTYKAGDKGPAGGVIFYVNPSATDGWRYLEAAPASTEFKAAWSSAFADVKGTNVELGTGKPNTQAIVNHALNTGESYRAAMVCDNLKSGGYDDWFLPSKSELNLMFVYLKEAGIGGFKDDWYWSSSDGTNRGAWMQRFSDGSQNGDGYGNWGGNQPGYKNQEHLVRAIRQF